MKLIQALKQEKDLLKKADDLMGKIKKHSAYPSYENPVYGNSQEDQQKQISAWVQAYQDIVKEILRLRIALQRTNLETPVTMEIGGKNITKSIAQWIHRRRNLAEMDRRVWESLTDRGIKEQVGRNSQDQPVEIKIMRCYSPEERDVKVEEYRSEPAIIDSTLETVNATVDLIE